MKINSFFNILLVMFPLTGSVLAADLPNSPHLVINGSAEIQVKPDILNLVIGVSQQNKNAEKAKQLVDKRVADYFSFLAKQSVPTSDINAARFILEPTYEYPEQKAPVLKGYTARREIKVTLRHPEKIGAILDGALAAGLNEIQSITPALADMATVQDKVRQLAVKDAVSKAKALASGFAETLGPVWSINYLQRSHPYVGTLLRSLGSNSQPEDKTWGQTMVVKDEVNVVFKLIHKNQ